LPTADAQDKAVFASDASSRPNQVVGAGNCPVFAVKSRCAKRSARFARPDDFSAPATERPLARVYLGKLLPLRSGVTAAANQQNRAKLKPQVRIVLGFCAKSGNEQTFSALFLSLVVKPLSLDKLKSNQIKKKVKACSMFGNRRRICV